MITEDLILLQAGIYCATRELAGPVPLLMNDLLDRRNLEAAWERVSGAEGAGTPGIDGLTARDVERRVTSWLAELADELYHGRYEPGAARLVTVEKSDASRGSRTLGILTVRDRVVHAALKQVLEPVLEPRFHPASYGYRPGRSVPAALARACALLGGRAPGEPRYPLALGLDVVDCFASIDHRRLLEALRRRVADEDLMALVERLLAAHAGSRGRWPRRRSVGLLQGSGLSPLLCNLYLDAIDRRLAELEAETARGVAFLRYADDLLVLGRDRGHLRRARRAARTEARALGLRLHERFGGRARRGLKWLGVELRPRAQEKDALAFGYFVPAERVERMLARLDEMTQPPSERIDASVFDPGAWIASINEQLLSWRTAYQHADDAGPVFRRIDERAWRRVRELLFRLTGLRGRALHRAHARDLPRGFRSWGAGGETLAVLSSLPPRNPPYRPRRPRWMSAPLSRMEQAVDFARARDAARIAEALPQAG